MAASTGEHLLFLTDRIQSASPDWLAVLLTSLQKSDVVGACPLIFYGDQRVCSSGRGFGLDHLTGSWNVNRSPEELDSFFPVNQPGNVSILPDEAALYKRSFLMRQHNLLAEFSNATAFHEAAGLAAMQEKTRFAYCPGAKIVTGVSARDHLRAVPITEARRLVAAMKTCGLKRDPYVHLRIRHQNGRSHLREENEPDHDLFLQSHMQAIDDAFMPQPPLAVFDRQAMCQFFTDCELSETCPVADAGMALLSDENVALWIIGSLLAPGVHDRFPRALTASDGGGFWAWLENQINSSPQAIERIRHLRVVQPAEQVRHVYTSRADLRWLHPLALTSAGERRFARWLFTFGLEQTNLERWHIWWHLMATAERRVDGLMYSYRIHPSWQEAICPAACGIPTPSEIKAWIKCAFGLDADIGMASPVSIPARPFATRPGRVDRMGVNVLGVFTFPSGLQQATRACTKALRAIPRNIAQRDVMVAGKMPDESRETYLDLNEHPVTIMVLPPLASRDTWLTRARLAWRQNQYSIGNWYTETANISEEIRRFALDYDEIWAPSRYIEHALKPVLDRPVYHMPTAHDIPEPDLVKLGQFGLPENTFTFFFMFDMYSCMERKNPLGLIRAFQQAFGGRRDVQLIIKISRGADYPKDTHQLRAQAASNPGIHIIDHVLTYRQALGLMKACDAYVSLHRAEGLGLTMAEAMLLGVPVVATAYSGNLDFMNDRNSILIPWKHTEVIRNDLPYPVGSQWAEPDIDAASAALLELESNRAGCLMRAEQALKDATVFFSIARFAKTIDARLTRIEDTIDSWPVDKST